jgi:glycosyltransferase involved in cell wall biosynthesis
MAALAEGALARNWRVTIASMPRVADGAEVAMPAGVALELDRHTLAGDYRWSPNLVRRLAGVGASVVHSHGLWTYASLAAARLCRRNALPHLLAPCGMLQGRALQHSRWKKKVAARLFQDRVLRQADCLHAKSEAELKSIRDYGLAGPVAVVPNPVHTRVEVADKEVAGFRRRHGIPEQERQALFLGRVHPVKGLERLLSAWAALGAARNNWNLLIAGPDEGGHQAVLERKIRELQITPAPRFIGPLDAGDKWLAFRSSELFVMPSDFENFGLAIAEAMSAGMPVITTTGTPWKIIEEEDCGWYVSAQRDGSLRAALAEALQKSEPELRAMGARAVHLAEDWSLDGVMDKILAVYHWLVAQGPQPDCVVCD